MAPSASSTAGSAAAVAGDPAWLAHRYDPVYDAVHFQHVDRLARRAVPFLVDAELKLTTALTALPREAVLSVAAASAPIHFIFHSAFCCSTLLARALDIPGIASTLSEPQILADMVGWRHRGGDPTQIGQVLDGALRLLARPFEPAESVVVKPSNVVNGLASAMLTIRPDAAAVLMHAPLRVFLASIARKGMDGRLWVRELLSKQLAEGFVELGFEPRDYLLHTDLQAAAIGWLAQRQLFAALVARWPERVFTLDSEVFVARPADTLIAVAKLFALPIDEARAVEIAAGNVFARNVKDGAPFAPDQRASDRARGTALHADEIEKVAIWTDAVAAAAGVPMVAPNPLIT